MKPKTLGLRRVSPLLLLIAWALPALAQFATPRDLAFWGKRRAPCTDITNGLVAYWTFEPATISNSTNALETTANNNTLAAYGSSDFGTAGHVGKGWATGSHLNQATLRGTNAASLNLSSNVTVTCWWLGNDFASAGAGHYPAIFSKTTDFTGYQLFINGDTGLLQAQWGTSGAWKTSPGFTPTSGVWYHLAGLNDGAKIRLYTNGVEVSTGTTWSGTPDTNTAGVVIGGHYSLNAALGYWGGVIDEVRVYNRALTAQEIACLASR